MVDTTYAAAAAQLADINSGVSRLNTVLDKLSQQIASVDQRLSLVERCVVNLYTHQDRQNRAIWTEAERSAFCAWLTENTDAVDVYSLDNQDDNLKF